MFYMSYLSKVYRSGTKPGLLTLAGVLVLVLYGHGYIVQ